MSGCRRLRSLFGAHPHSRQSHKVSARLVMSPGPQTHSEPRTMFRPSTCSSCSCGILTCGRQVQGDVRMQAALQLLFDLVACTMKNAQKITITQQQTVTTCTRGQSLRQSCARRPSAWQNDVWQAEKAIIITEGVVALGDGLDTPRVQLSQLPKRSGARGFQPLGQQPPDAWQLPRLALAVVPEPPLQALLQQQRIGRRRQPPGVRKEPALSI